MKIEKFNWIREPKNYNITENKIFITTEPYTDLWQKTYYHFINDNAPLLVMEIEEEYFSFTVKVDFTNSKVRFDQSGIIVYLDSENWIKGSIEYENDLYQHLGSVVTNNGYSDWATTEISSSIKSMYYRLSRRGNDYLIENSIDGVKFQQMRICHLHKGEKKIKFGIYACSPENSSFETIFSEMSLTECKWLAHDGQQPNIDVK